VRLSRFALVIGIAAMLVGPALAADVAILKNGFSIRHESRQPLGTMTRLYTGPNFSSYVDIPTTDIDHYEKDDTPAPAPSSTVLQTPPAAPVVHSATGTKITPKSAPPVRPEDVQQAVNEASDKSSLDPDLISSVIRAESGFNVRAVSPKGAQGLMQLMPQTASNLGVPNAFDPKANVDGGSRYLRWLLERYNYDLVKALAAYNAGPRRVEQYRGVPPYHETRAYVARIIKDFNRKKLAEQKAAALAAKEARQGSSKAASKKALPSPSSAATAPATR